MMHAVDRLQRRVCESREISVAPKAPAPSTSTGGGGGLARDTSIEQNLEERVDIKTPLTVDVGGGGDDDSEDEDGPKLLSKTNHSSPSTPLSCVSHHEMLYLSDSDEEEEEGVDDGVVVLKGPVPRPMADKQQSRIVTRFGGRRSDQSDDGDEVVIVEKSAEADAGSKVRSRRSEASLLVDNPDVVVIRDDTADSPKIVTRQGVRRSRAEERKSPSTPNKRLLLRTACSPSPSSSSPQRLRRRPSQSKADASTSTGVIGLLELSPTRNGYKTSPATKSSPPREQYNMRKRPPPTPSPVKSAGGGVSSPAKKALRRSLTLRPCSTM